MKKPPDLEKLENILRSSAIVSGGFLGTDMRGLDEVIETDLAELEGLGFTIINIVSRMKEFTNTAIPALGNWIAFEDKYQIRVEESKGVLTCPWPHPGTFPKRITYVRNLQTNDSIKWSDLNIHLIESHNFFEGKGSPYRIEPKELVKILFNCC